MRSNLQIKEDTIIYGKELSEIELLSLILGERPVKCLSGNNKFTLKDIDIMTDQELLRLNNIGPETLCKIRGLITIVKRNSLDCLTLEKNKITSPKDCLAFSKDMITMEQEVLRVLFLNTKNVVIGIKDVFKGSLNTSIVHPREIFKEAIKRSSASIIIMHNHPSGDPTPSREDINITVRVKECGDIIGIKLLDHVIVGREKHASLKEKGIV